jgi:hypothetical protein
LVLTSESEVSSQVLDDLGLSFALPDLNLSGLAEHHGMNLQKALSILCTCARVSTQSLCTGFNILSSATARAYLLCPREEFWNGWEDAMGSLREVYRLYKRRLRVQRIGEISPRQPSPLLIQIKRTKGGRFYGLILAFDSEQYFGPNWATLDSFLAGLSDFEVRPVTLP